MTRKFSNAALGAYRDAKAVLELARAEGRIPPQKPRQAPMIGCEPPAWFKVDNMERFLATLPSNVGPTEIVEVFVRTGCPVERFKFEGCYYFVAISVASELAQEVE